MIAVELRRLTGDDLEAIERTERASYPTPWSRTMFAGEIAKSSSICLGAVDVAADLLVGHLIVSRYVDAWHVMNLAVRPAYRRLGIASDLLQELFRLTARDQDRGYTLEVRVSNAAAIRLYEQHGFRSHGLRRGYYTDNREDAIVMWRHPVDGGDPGRVILALETSCDETAAAVVTQAGEIRSSVVASQAELHARFGGVVPEIASRRHLELIGPVVEQALADAGTTLEAVDRVAVTRGPGLIGALLVGLSAAKAIAWARGLPLVPVDHLHGHVAALYLEPDPVEPPFLCLLATGGHTLLVDVRDRSGFTVVGGTVDDAVGEAFDKGARLLGLGYPGGAALDRLAAEGDADAFDFPVARVPGHGFSFSGVKTALLYTVRDLAPGELERRRADLAASYQRALVTALVDRLDAAAAATGARRICVVGGVAANSGLRAALAVRAAAGRDVRAAPLALCTDNAAMIASAARYADALQPADYLSLDAYAAAGP